MYTKNVFRAILLFSLATNVLSQICTSIGKMCHRTTDCCNGCCEAFTCVDRPYSCSTDMIAQPGYANCATFRCPPDNICYLRETCPPENPCPRVPSCKRVNYNTNYNNTDYRYRNSSPPTVLISPSAILFVLLSAFTPFIIK